MTSSSVEVDEARADEAKAILRREMLTLPDWAAGLPLQSEESVCALLHQSEGGACDERAGADRVLRSYQEQRPRRSSTSATPRCWSRRSGPAKARRP